MNFTEKLMLFFLSMVVLMIIRNYLINDNGQLELMRNIKRYKPVEQCMCNN